MDIHASELMHVAAAEPNETSPSPALSFVINSLFSRRTFAAYRHFLKHNRAEVRDCFQSARVRDVPLQHLADSLALP